MESEAFSYQGAGRGGGRGYASLLLQDDHARSRGTSPTGAVSLNPPVIGISAAGGVPGPEHDERLLECLRYSRAIRVLAVLNAILVLYFASAFTPLILMLWGPIAGYVSSTFQLKAAYAFWFYYSLRVSWDIGWILSGGETWIVVWVFLFTDIASLGLVHTYLKVLRTCTPADVVRLRDPRTSWTSAFFPLHTSLAAGTGVSSSDDDDES